MTFLPCPLQEETQKEKARAIQEARELLSSSDNFSLSLNVVPSGHLFSPVKNSTLVQLLDVPPHVTDAQLLYAVSKFSQALTKSEYKALEN